MVSLPLYPSALGAISRRARRFTTYVCTLLLTHLYALPSAGPSRRSQDVHPDTAARAANGQDLPAGSWRQDSGRCEAGERARPYRQGSPANVATRQARVCREHAVSQACAYLEHSRHVSISLGAVPQTRGQGVCDAEHPMRGRHSSNHAKSEPQPPAARSRNRRQGRRLQRRRRRAPLVGRTSRVCQRPRPTSWGECVAATYAAPSRACRTNATARSAHASRRPAGSTPEPR